MVGGGPEQELFNLLFPLIKQVAPGVFTLVMKNLGPFLQIFILLGSAARGGSKIRSNQRGGAGLPEETKQRLTNILVNLEGNFTGNQQVLDCIGTLKSKFAPDPTAPPLPPNKPEPEIDLSVIQGELDEVQLPEASTAPPGENTIDKFKRIFNEKVKGTLNRKIESVSSKFTPEEKTCLITLKEAVLSDFKTNIQTQLESIKNNDIVKGVISTFEKTTAAKGAVMGSINALKAFKWGGR
jgi:hypothetical protein